MKTRNWKQIIELGCRGYVFLFLNVYGWAKIFGGQFYTSNKMPETVLKTTIANISDFDLAWAFMGRSYGYLLFIGLSEIIGAWLLLFTRTKLLGTSMLLVILLNVIVFDIFFLDAYGALGSAIIYSLLLLVVLWINRNSVLQAFQSLTFTTRNKKTLDQSKLQLVLLALLLMALIFGVDQLVVNLLGHGKG